MFRNSKNTVLNSKLYFFTKDVLSNPLFSGTAIMIVGSNASNLLAYIYHFVFGRILGPESYGELAVSISLIGMLGAIYGFIGTVIVKFASASGEEDLPGLFQWFKRKTIVAAVGVGIVLLLLAHLISSFLHLDKNIVLLMSPIVMLSLISYVYRAFIQGLMKFLPFVLSTFSEMAARLILGLMFVYLGWNVMGAMVGILLSGFLGIYIAYYPLAEIRKQKEITPFAHSKKIVIFAVPILISSVAHFSFISTDLLLVKHFFSATDAGLYAALATLSKIIFYGTAPVATVMFPIVSKKFSRGEKYLKVFMLSVLLTVAISGSVLLLYYFFPEIPLRSLFGDTYISAASELPLFGLFISVFTLASLFANYFLSREKTHVAYLMAAAALFQGIGIWLFHNSITQVITTSLAAATLLLIGLILYFIHEIRNTKK